MKDLSTLIGFIIALCLIIAGSFCLGSYMGQREPKPKEIMPEQAVEIILKLYSEREHLPDSTYLAVPLNGSQVYLIRFIDPVTGFEGIGVYEANGR